MSKYILLTIAFALGCSSGGETGDSCGSTDDCDTGRCEIGGSFPGGVCTPSCSTNGECPDGFSCISRSSGMCLRNCTASSECEDERGDAWQCRDESLQDGGGNQMVCIGD